MKKLSTKKESIKVSSKKLKGVSSRWNFDIRNILGNELTTHKEKAIALRELNKKDFNYRLIGRLLNTNDVSARNWCLNIFRVKKKEVIEQPKRLKKNSKEKYIVIPKKKSGFNPILCERVAA